MCDSYYAGDKDNRFSVTGYCIYLNGCLVSFKSRAQRSQRLSSTEAEYVALSEICTKILFVRMIMEFLGEKVNEKISRRTKHVDTRTHFIRNYVENGRKKITFVRSEDNDRLV